MACLSRYQLGEEAFENRLDICTLLGFIYEMK
jgi:hypothetical protein